MGKTSLAPSPSLASDYLGSHYEYRKKEWDVESERSDSDRGSLSLPTYHEPSVNSISISSVASKISKLGSYVSKVFSSCFDTSDRSSGSYSDPVEGVRLAKKRDKNSKRALATPTMQQVKDGIYDYFSK